MKPETLWPSIRTPGDLASYMLRHIHHHGSSLIPQPLIDAFGGHVRSIGTQAGGTAGWEFRITGSYTTGSQSYDRCGTVAVTSLGINVYDEDDRQIYWVDCRPAGDATHRDMHYHQAGWARSHRIYAWKEPDRFWKYVSSWQSPEFTTVLEENKGNEDCLYDLDGGC